MSTNIFTRGPDGERVIVKVVSENEVFDTLVNNDIFANGFVLDSGKISLDLGEGIEINSEGKITSVAGPNGSSKTVLVDQSHDIVLGFEKIDIHNNETEVKFFEVHVDEGWKFTNNKVSYSGHPNKVRGTFSINCFDEGSSNYWSRPKVRVLRDGEIIAIIDDLVMQQNRAYDGDATINGSFIDKLPTENPEYTFEWFRKDNRVSTIPPQSYSRLTLEAVEKVEVYCK